MKTKSLLHLCVLSLLILLNGCVTSRTPVGSTVAKLDPKIWNGTWTGDDGSIVRTRIKDARLGIVQVSTKSAWLKPAENHDLLIRMLGSLTIANEKSVDDYQFASVSIDNHHLLIFWPDKTEFDDLITHHKLTGIIEKGKKGAATGCTINGLSDNDLKRLVRDGVAYQSLFDMDPSTVLIHDKWLPLW